MSAPKIEVNYEMLDQVSAKFLQQGDEAEQMLQNIRNHMDSLQGEWIGEGSNAFFSEMSDLVLPAATKLVQAHNEAGNASKRIAELMSTAEEEAASAFQVAIQANGLSTI